MKPEMDRIQMIFAQALRLAEAERENFLAEACKGEPELRSQVESLLQAHAQAGDFLGKSVMLPESDNTVERTGTMIGRYKLLEKIGEGGFGVVWMAGQEEPVRRRVALKIIKAGMDTRQVLARFEAERQALAMMEHPNIAHVFDGGATDTGRPYFVMELVRGVKITDYCDEKELSTCQRLDLFIQVCQAIQHAHQKGIIHRDIKPSNILVTINDGVPVPKVIDFGIAKATGEQHLTDKTIFTAFEQFIGTPAYMSPEQAVMTSLDIDTRSDIYALGVLLYELLTGKTPFDAHELLAAGLDDMRRTIREKEPIRPSARLSTMPDNELSNTAQRRGLDAPKLVSQLRGDLDWIVMKCLEKDRGRRYETPNGLAADIRRHLNSEPVIARRPGKFYEFQKTVRRHKFGFGAAAALIAALAAGVVFSTHEAIRAWRAEQKAEMARANETLLRQRLEYRLHITEARDFFDAGKPGDAKKALDEIRPELFKPAGEQMAVRRLLGWEYAREYHWANALSNLAVVVQNDSPQWDKVKDVALDHYYYSTAVVMVNDLASYNNYRQNLAADLYRTNDAEGSEFLCRLVLLTPATPAFMQSLAPFVNVASAWTNFDATDVTRLQNSKAWKCCVLAMVYYRNGEYTNALTWADNTISQHAPDPTLAPAAHAFRAMALYRIGQVQEAKLELDWAKEVVDPIFKKGVSKVTNNEGRWFEWHIDRIYINEAEKMMGESAGASAR